MVDYLAKLSRFVAETSFDDLSNEAVSAVRDVTLDTVGAIVAGSQESENSAFADLMARRSGPGTATILGHGMKAEPMLATLVNSTAGVALEMDEGNRFGGGHPAIHTLPGALAVAEEMGASGQKQRVTIFEISIFFFGTNVGIFVRWDWHGKKAFSGVRTRLALSLNFVRRSEAEKAHSEEGAGLEKIQSSG